MLEKRKYVRLDQELSLTFERKGPVGTLRGEGTTKNISPTGLCVVTRASLGVGEKITLLLTLSKTSQPLSLQGRVTRVHPASIASSSEVGIELSSGTDRDYTDYLLFLCDLLCTQLAKQTR